MIRQAIIAVVTFAALWIGLFCSVSAFRNWSVFSFGVVGVEIGSGALIVSYGGAFVTGDTLPWVNPHLYRVARGAWVLTVPLWIPFVLFAAYPTVAFIRGPLRRWRRRRKGLCIDCGYDLTGNVSEVCSECGAAK